MLWWDEKHPVKLVFFASGGLQWQSEDAVQFTQSIERVVPSPA
jgi:hypothetical protein